MISYELVVQSSTGLESSFFPATPQPSDSLSETGIGSSALENLAPKILL